MQSESQKSVIKRIAAIDLGTNSFHSVIVDIYSDGSFYTIDRLKEMVLLAEKGVGDRLSDEAIDRGIQALAKIKTLCDHQNVEKILAYATSAIREAENGGEFIQRAIDELDVKINAISGRIEAEMIGYAVRHAVHLGEDPVLMMDIGGGSVEFMLGNVDKFFFLTSKKIGVGRMAADIVNMDPISKKEIKALRKHYRETLKDVAEAFDLNKTDVLVGSSGTFENIAMMIGASNGGGPSLSLNEMEITANRFFDFYKRMIPLDRDERLKVKGLEEKRVDLIIPGLVLVHFILKEFGIKKIRISDQALREGIVLRYIDKELNELKTAINYPDPRRRSVFELLRKCDWHRDHSSHVADIAVKIFDHLFDELDLLAEDRELLEYAAYMHDIGYYISHRKHHKHALYLIRNADLKGFKEEQIEIMAHVARYHRRSTPKSRHSSYNSLSDDIKKRISNLSGILRVADGLDRSHYQNVRDLDINIKKKKIVLHICTEEDPKLEIWGALRKSQLFEEVTGKKLKIKRMDG